MRARASESGFYYPSKSAVPNLFGTRDRFHGRQFFHGWGGGGAMVQAIIQAMGSDGKRQMKLRWGSPSTRLLLCGPVPNRGLWTPVLNDQ